MQNRDILRLAYEEVIRKLAMQAAYVTSLRNQAGISAAISGLIGTFFGGLASEPSQLIADGAVLGFSLPTLIALVCLATSIGFSAMVVIHYSEFTFSFNAKRMLESWDASLDEEIFLTKYIKDGEWFFQDNERRIDEVQSKLWWAVVSGFAQIFPWSIQLGGNS